MNNINNITIEEQINTLNILVKTNFDNVQNLLDIKKIFNYFLQSCNQLTTFIKYKDLLKYIKSTEYVHNNHLFPNLLIYLLHCKNMSSLVIQCLLNIGYDPNVDFNINTNNALYSYLICNNNIQYSIVKLFIDNGVNVNINNTTLLFIYLIHNKTININIIKLLVNNGVDINYISINDKNNILHTICRYNRNLDIIKYFVENGCDVNLKNNDGMTPFDRLLYYSFKENRKNIDIKNRTYKPIDQKVKYLLSVMKTTESGLYCINTDIYKDYLLNKMYKKCDEIIEEMKKNPIHNYYENKKNNEGYKLILDKFDMINDYIESETGLKDFLEIAKCSILKDIDFYNISFDIIETCFDIKIHYDKIDKLKNKLQKFRQDYINYLVLVELN